MCKVSIIVPIYNVENYIEKCARSLFEQTFLDIEYIFVDDSTTDNSIEILKKILLEYPTRNNNSIIIRHDKNKGLPSARKTGLSVVHGDYILHFDSDDWAERTMICDMYDTAIKNDADIVSCDFRMVYTDRIVNYETIDFTEDKVNNLKRYISFGWTVIWNLLVRKSIYLNNNINPLEGYTYCEDFNLSVKLLLNSTKMIHLNKILYNYNKMNSSSIMHALNEKTMNDEQILYTDIINYLKDKDLYNVYEKQMGWRILKSKQEWMLKSCDYDKFLDFHPESHKYIWSCPFINFKLKIMMWSLTHNFSFISKFMLLLRYLRHGKNF